MRAKGLGCRNRTQPPGGSAAADDFAVSDASCFGTVSSAAKGLRSKAVDVVLRIHLSVFRPGQFDAGSQHLSV